MSTLSENAPARAALPYAGVVALGVALACLPYMGTTNHVISLATSAVIFAIAGSGLGFLWGQSGQLSMAHAAVFGLGGYAGAITAKFFGLGFLAAMPIAVVVGLVAGALVALPSLRTQGHYFVILTFAIGEVIAVVQKRVEWLTGGQEGISAHPGKETLFGLRLVNRAEYFSLITLIGTAVLIVLLLIMRSRWGTTLRGMRENAPLAASLGVNVTMNRIYAFAISGAVAGLAGHLYLYQMRFIEPNLFTAQASIIFLMIVLLGGKAYLLGPAVGSFFYFFLSEFLGLPPVWNLIGFGVLLIVMILAAPNGILSIIQNLFAGRAKAGEKTTVQDKEQQVADLPGKA
jgi:branched-chain amino acid transport system permease protein